MSKEKLKALGKAITQFDPGYKHNETGGQITPDAILNEIEALEPLLATLKEDEIRAFVSLHSQAVFTLIDQARSLNRYELANKIIQYGLYGKIFTIQERVGLLIKAINTIGRTKGELNYSQVPENYRDFKNILAEYKEIEGHLSEENKVNILAARGRHNETLLLLAAQAQDEEFAIKLIKEENAGPITKPQGTLYDECQYPLFWAVSLGQVGLTRMILGKGVSIDNWAINTATLRLSTVRSDSSIIRQEEIPNLKERSLQTLKLLTEHGIDINTTHDNGLSDIDIGFLKELDAKELAFLLDMGFKTNNKAMYIEPRTIDWHYKNGSAGLDNSILEEAEHIHAQHVAAITAEAGSVEHDGHAVAREQSPTAYAH